LLSWALGLYNELPVANTEGSLALQIKHELGKVSVASIHYYIYFNYPNLWSTPRHLLILRQNTQCKKRVLESVISGDSAELNNFQGNWASLYSTGKWLISN